jgi:MFS family permease
MPRKRSPHSGRSGIQSSPDASPERREDVEEPLLLPIERSGYNLAARVYGERPTTPARPAAGTAAANGATDVNGATAANGAGASFNLAERVYATAPPVAPPASAPAVAPPPAAEADSPATAVAAPEPATGGRGARRQLRTFQSLAVPDFRWFFASLLGHFTSMNMQMFIRGWMVFQLTGSYTLLGGIALASSIPQVGLSLFGGVLADIVPQKKWVVQIGQLTNGANAAAIGLLILTDQLVVEHLLIAAVLQGTSMAMMMPARQAMTPEIVGQARLMNAMALMTAGMNGARLVMPGLAGWLVAAVGGGVGVEGAQYVYFMMAALYLWAALMLRQVSSRPRVRATTEVRKNPLRDIADGFRYIRRNEAVRSVLTVNLVLETVSMPYFFLLPGFVAEVLDGGAFEIGTLLSISGIGALVGSLLIASMPNRRRAWIMLASSILFGAALAGFAFSTVYWISALFFIVVGFGQTARWSLSSVLIQAYTNDEYRGRVSSVYNLSWGVTSFSAFFVGLLTDEIGPQWAIGGTGILLILIVVPLMMRSGIRDLD